MKPYDNLEQFTCDDCGELTDNLSSTITLDGNICDFCITEEQILGTW